MRLANHCIVFICILDKKSCKADCSLFKFTSKANFQLAACHELLRTEPNENRPARFSDLLLSIATGLLIVY